VPTPTPTLPLAWVPPSPAAVAAPPPAELPRIAAAEKNGVRVEIELERNPMPAGEWTGVRTRVTNLGGDALTWFHDGCATLVYVAGTLTGRQWRPGFWDFDGKIGEFEDRAVEQASHDGAIRITFLDKDLIGRGSYGCADIGMSDLIAPGDTIERRRIWDGFAGTLLSPPPGGLVRLTGTFGYYWRDEAPADITTQTISVELDAWIERLDDAYIHPSEAIDAALFDQRLADLISSRDLFNGNGPVVRFDPQRGDWMVGLLDDYPESIVHLVVVDGRTGAREDWIERPWNRDVEGSP